jgi:hypothetical protein
VGRRDAGRERGKSVSKQLREKGERREGERVGERGREGVGREIERDGRW